MVTIHITSIAIPHGTQHLRSSFVAKIISKCTPDWSQNPSPNAPKSFKNGPQNRSKMVFGSIWGQHGSQERFFIDFGVQFWSWKCSPNRSQNQDIFRCPPGTRFMRWELPKRSKMTSKMDSKINFFLRRCKT